MQRLLLLILLLLVWGSGFLMGVNKDVKVEMTMDPGDYTVILEPCDGGGYTARFVRP